MASWQSKIVRGLCRLAIKRSLSARAPSAEASVAAIRRAFERADPLNRGFTRGLQIVPVDAGDVRGEWVLPVAPRDRALLYVHGGAYVACTPLTHRRFTTALARRSGLPAFVVEYRKAPEHRFPAALDDVVAAYDALRRRIPAHGIVLAGDSAGGGLVLAAAIALRARDRGDVPAGVIAFSPWTDLLGTGTSIVVNARSDDMLVGANMAATALNYVSAGERRTPLASPLYAELGGLPPILLFASESEVLRDDAVRFADRARSAGVAVELVLEDAMPHIWPIFCDVMPEAQRAVTRTVAFLQRVLFTPTNQPAA